MRPLGLILASLVAVVAALIAGEVRAPAAQPAKEAIAVGTGGAVASVDPEATRAGIEILRAGGNAVDAAVAANAVLGVTEPFVAGIGGGGFMVVYLAREHRVITIDGREKAPQTFPENAFIDPATGQPIPFFPQRVTSGMAVGVPGTLATWARADSQFGTMPLARLLQPAIAVAEHGFTVDDTFRSQVASNLTRLNAFTSSRSLFLTADGQPPGLGSTFANPDLARTYRLIAHDGANAFYDGPIGAALVDTVRQPPLAPDSQLGFTVPPGVMTTGDLANYSAPLRAPTHVTYRGYDVYGMGPPSSGGSTIAEALNILEGFDLSTSDRALALHRYLEASKLAFADRNRWIGDSDFASVPLDGLLSKDFAAERRCLIGGTALPTPVAPANGSPARSARCQRSELDRVVLCPQLGERLGVRFSALGDQIAQLVEIFLMSGRRGNQKHAARRRTGIAERVRDAGRDEHEGSGPAVHDPFAATQIEFALQNVEQLLDLCVVVGAGVESRCNRELEQRALLGVFGREQVIDPGLMQGDPAGLTVMQDNSLDGHLGLLFALSCDTMGTS